MKKIVVSFVVIFLSFSYFSNINYVSAQKIVCKVEPKKYVVTLLLLQYDDNDIEEGYTWGYTFWKNFNSLDDNEKQFLEQIEGKTIDEEDALYDEILMLSEELHNMGYHPIMCYIPDIMVNLNNDMFEILRRLL